VIEKKKSPTAEAGRLEFSLRYIVSQKSHDITKYRDIIAWDHVTSKRKIRRKKKDKRKKREGKKEGNNTHNGF